MNLIGKLLIVAILIMSLVFMGLSMGVYATHKNWKAASDKLADQLTKQKAKNQQDISTYDLRIEQVEREKAAEKQQAVKLEAELVAMVDQNKQIQAELDGLRQNQRDQVSAVASTQKINETLASEVGGLRQKIRDEQQTRDRVFKAALDATEQLHQAAGEYNAARERTEQLTKQVAGMTAVMKAGGLDPATEPGSVVPTVEGVVSQVRRAAGAQLIEVTIGSDDGVKAGNTLEVSRGEKYLGRLDIIETSPDKSVARVDRRFQQGQIQEGDRVATRIKL
ncbi:MAG: hypothetical protein IT425_14315 [Pirellulales bacterium]|nr:hypothetical protein [Pirellulales bacterium]